MKSKAMKTLMDHPFLIAAFLSGFIFDTLKPTIEEYIKNSPGKTAQNLTVFFIGLSALMFLIQIFIIIPIAQNYIYEVCELKESRGFALRGLKRCGGRMALLTIAVFGILGLFMLLPISWVWLLIIPIMLFTHPLYTAIAVEGKFFTGLKNGFNYGTKYIGKIMVAYILALVPIIIINLLFSLRPSGFPVSITIALDLYGSAVLVFMMIYSMHNYLYLKNDYRQHEEILDEMTESNWGSKGNDNWFF